MQSQFDPLRSRKTMLLTCFRRDGTPAASPVSVAFDGDRVFFRTYHTTWKARRLSRDPRVWAAPSSFRGRPRGPAIAGQARLLEGGDADTARRTLARRAPILQGILVPLAHKLARYRTMHFEITSRDTPAAASEQRLVHAPAARSRSQLDDG